MHKTAIDVFKKYKNPAISLREGPCEKVCSYGIVDGDKIDENIYKITQLIEKLKRDQTSSNLAILGRYILTDDIFDKIKETESGFNGEIQLTDAMSKLDEIYGVKFPGKVFNIENRLEWIKSSIDYAMADDEFKGDLVNYMKTFAG